jgi:hypothetical protein
MGRELPPGADWYFETIQPEWRNLTFTSEVVNLYWRFPEAEDLTNVEPVVEAGVEERVSRQRRFLRALDLLDDEDELSPDGVWLATVYQPPAQRPLTESEVSLGRKSERSDAEQEAFRGLLVGHHWLPMLATAHQVVEERVPTEGIEDSHVESFAGRLESIDAYSDLSEGAWETRAGVHYDWFVSIGFARNHAGELTLTDDGRAFHDRVREYYPETWAELGPR